jgi:acetyltransferase-like isoleucine patch superfamily enzyme
VIWLFNQLKVKNMNNFLTLSELKKIGLKKFGKNLQISRNALLINPQFISIGNDVRIDAFVVLTASKKKIIIGSNVHLGMHCYINGSHGFEIKNFSSISSGCRIFTSSDDYSGNFLFSPTVPKKYTKPKNKKVLVEKFVNIGANSVVLPGVTIREGSAVGALSLINKNLNKWEIYLGVPVKKIGDRSKKIIDLSKKYLYEKKV